MSLSVGTTNRRSVSTDKFLDVKIPVPSLSEQKEIVENYYTMIRQANDIIELSWTKMDEYYISVLQAENYRYNPLLQYMFGYVNFKKLTRWDSWVTDTGLTSDKYDIVPFGQLVLGKPQYGANVIRVRHNQGGEGDSINDCYLKISLETRGFDHFKEIQNALSERGYKILSTVQ